MTAHPLDELNARIRVCRRCPLAASRTLAVPGEGPVPARLMLVGEAPGEQEDRTGRPFVGNAGRLLDRLLQQAGLRREEAFITGAVKCRPPGNRDPRAAEIAACRVYLDEQVAAVRPQVVVAMGRAALRALLGTGGGPPAPSLAQVRGRALPRDGHTLVATYHPAAAFYREELRDAIRADLARVRELLPGSGAQPDTGAAHRGA